MQARNHTTTPNKDVCLCQTFNIKNIGFPFEVIILINLSKCIFTIIIPLIETKDAS